MDLDATRERASDYLATTAETVSQVRERCLDDIVTAAAIAVTSLRAGGALLICGNGGSAADAQHLATEFVSTLTLDHPRPSIRALALTTDTSLLTAVANDFGVERVFARQVESLGREGDVLIAISTSRQTRPTSCARPRRRGRGGCVSWGSRASPADCSPRSPTSACVCPAP
jgi:D-sedoheptulose 7-phosphate isomerase